LPKVVERTPEPVSAAGGLRGDDDLCRCRSFTLPKAVKETPEFFFCRARPSIATRSSFYFLSPCRRLPIDAGPFLLLHGPSSYCEAVNSCEILIEAVNSYEILAYFAAVSTAASFWSQGDYRLFFRRRPPCRRLSRRRLMHGPNFKSGTTVELVRPAGPFFSFRTKRSVSFSQTFEPSVSTFSSRIGVSWIRRNPIFCEDCQLGLFPSVRSVPLRCLRLLNQSVSTFSSRIGVSWIRRNPIFFAKRSPAHT
jgi:hypothetical protein